MDELNRNNIPGSWSSYQNIYNLVDGSVRPRDPSVYVILARMFQMNLEEIISRYSDVDFSPQSTEEKKEEVVIENKTINW